MIMLGGGAKGNIWLQILADIWQKPLVVPAYTEEATSLGAAVCGGVVIGAFRDFSVINKINAPVRRINPNREYAGRYEKLFSLFNKSYDALAGTFRELAECNRS